MKTNISQHCIVEETAVILLQKHSIYLLIQWNIQLTLAASILSVFSEVRLCVKLLAVMNCGPHIVSIESGNKQTIICVTSLRFQSDGI